ncbi:MAG: hypothetical protein LBE13_00775, partial [Bacteroidales bacterium]|nr:hypothetical protein [Bacteroidales bacterium]
CQKSRRGVSVRRRVQFSEVARAESGITQGISLPKWAQKPLNKGKIGVLYTRFERYLAHFLP